MKTSEFKRAVQKLDHSLEIVDSPPTNEISVIWNSLSLININTRRKMIMSTHQINLNYPGPEEELYVLAAQYAATPINERKDAEKFRVRLFGHDYGWLNWGLEKDELFTANKPDGNGYRTVFTLTQYNGFREQYPWLPAYDKDNPIFEEVTDDD